MPIKIIKNGDLSRLKATIEFTCKKCGCVFTGDNEDYKSEYIHGAICVWHEIKCPYCGNWVMK